MKELIEVGGGMVIWEEEVGSFDKKLLCNAIRLMLPEEASQVIKMKRKVKNAFHIRYIFQCINELAILLNLNHYKVTK